jgi:superfamily II DNA/RNA helicase
VLGREDAVVTIHGGTRRDERRVIREDFTHNPDTRILVATDAAGEGLNLLGYQNLRAREQDS